MQERVKIKMKTLLQNIFSVKNWRNPKYIINSKIKCITLFRKKWYIIAEQTIVFDYIEVDIVDHCNLNCRACQHFCPLANNGFMDVERFKNDLKMLKSKVCIRKLRLLGGEPLLHPDITKFFQYSREILPYSDIRVCTNGTLVENMNEEFYTAMREYKIKLDFSRYPVVKYKTSKIFELLEQHDVQGGGISPVKNFSLQHISDGSSDKDEIFNDCGWRYCKQLRNGKLYRCPQGVYIRRFNDYFNESIPVDEGIDIYKASADEILKYLNTSFDTCKYCLKKKDLKFVPWEISKKNKEEWFADKV